MTTPRDLVYQTVFGTTRDGLAADLGVTVADLPRALPPAAQAVLLDALSVTVQIITTPSTLPPTRRRDATEAIIRASVRRKIFRERGRWEVW